MTPPGIANLLLVFTDVPELRFPADPFAMPQVQENAALRLIAFGQCDDGNRG